MKKPILNILAFICFTVLICNGACATSNKSKALAKSKQKTKNEQPLKTIPEAIGPPKEREKAIEQNKIIWGPQEKFLDKKSMQEKIEIWTIEPGK